MIALLVPTYTRLLFLSIPNCGLRLFHLKFRALFGLSSRTESSHGKTYREEFFRALVFVLFAAQMRRLLSTYSPFLRSGKLWLITSVTFLISHPVLRVLLLVICSMGGMVIYQGARTSFCSHST